MRRFLFLLICCSIVSHLLGQKKALTQSEIDGLLKANLTCDSTLQFLQTLDIEAAEPTALKAEALLKLGLTHYCLGEYGPALKSYQQSLEIFLSLDIKEKPAEILNLIGTLHKKQGDFELAEDYFNQGLDLAISKNDSLGIGNSLNNMGVLLFQQQQFVQSLRYYLQSTEIKSAIGDTIGLSYNYDNLGMNYAMLERYDSAQWYFELAKEFKLLIGDRAGYGFVANNIGEMLMSQGDLDEAVDYFNEALAVARELSYPEFEQHVLNMLSQVAELSGNYKDALNRFKSHVSLKDSLFNERKSQQVAELETKYQTEKKEQTIALQAAALERNQLLLIAAGIALFLILIIGLLWQNRMKKLQQIRLQEASLRAKEAEINATISSQEKERARYARDLHDGFGQMISILNMNLKNLQGSPKPDERQKVYEASSKVIDDMYDELKNICFDLMPQTLVKNGLESALREFSDRISQGGDLFIEVNCFGINERLSELQEISLYRICQEWINNILKYGDAKKITLQITKDESEITLLIEDDGTGFDKNILSRGKGNGWKNLNTRCKLMNGNLELETQENAKGTSLIVNAPVVVKQVVKNTVHTV